MSHLEHLEHEILNVPDHDGVFLAISAQNYADADLALWRLKRALEGTEPSPAQAEHMEQLRQNRRECYSDLRDWMNALEAERLRLTEGVRP
ncbi:MULTISPECIES: hypothetical protein [unclassified Aeromicrobium]|uniref:hypothetical protein n=1 Tax=unclassified Aeromicrobium TaxID=2633570 RepID=UPI002889C587|nr:MULTISPECIES: hypothetical protein [unclassified Aeromicrobium]